MDATVALERIEKQMTAIARPLHADQKMLLAGMLAVFFEDTYSVAYAAGTIDALRPKPPLNFAHAHKRKGDPV